jgi:hypothetical protein
VRDTQDMEYLNTEREYWIATLHAYYIIRQMLGFKYLYVNVGSRRLFGIISKIPTCTSFHVLFCKATMEYRGTSCIVS